MNGDMLTLNEQVVAVIDDDEDGRETLVDLLDDYKFESVPIVGNFGADIDRLIREVEELKPGFVICDHRLTAQQFAAFSGLEVVERLLEDKVPAMLLTTFQEPERLTLRAARARVPVIKGRDDFRVEDVRDLREIVLSEMAERPVASRRPHRVLLRVEAVRDSQADVVVPSWSRDHAFVLTKDLIAPNIRNRVRPGEYLLGDVNIGAEKEEDIYFDNVDEIIEGIEDIL